jgi:hypothetical protein
MMNMQTIKKLSLTAIMSMTLVVNYSASASNLSLQGGASDWQPVASDKLIKLPANIIEKRIQKDFHASKMAMRMAELDENMQGKVAMIKAMQQQQDELEGEAAQNHKFELRSDKSDYLDLLQENHNLHQSALNKKQTVYKNVLDKMRLQTGKVSNSEAFKIKQAQAVARKRMEKVMAKVDQSFLHAGNDKPSAYADEYTKNLSQIENLKMAISRHQANKSLTLNGIDISSEEYLRQLLMSVSTEQSLLDQEGLMLSYMAKLVALDAQSLEYEVAYGDEDEFAVAKESSKAADVTSLFY